MTAVSMIFFFDDRIASDVGISRRKLPSTNILLSRKKNFPSNETRSYPTNCRNCDTSMISRALYQRSYPSESLLVVETHLILTILLSFGASSKIQVSFSMSELYSTSMTNLLIRSNTEHNGIALLFYSPNGLVTISIKAQ